MSYCPINHCNYLNVFYLHKEKEYLLSSSCPGLLDWYSGFLAWYPAINIPSSQPSVSKLTLLHAGKQIQVYFSNNFHNGS